MHTDTSPTAVGDRMRPLNRRILRKHLIVDGVVAGVAVVIASLVTAFVFWAAKRLHRWLPETDVHIDGHAFSIDSLPEAVTSNGRTVAILFVGVIATGALILTACVHGCLGAATVRTYLGAGLTRREFFGMHIRASLSNTAAVASFGLAAVLLQAAVAGDASGRLTLTHTEQTASSWILLLAAITSSLGAYWLGFTVASLFVRFPWYIPAAGLLALSMVEGLVRLFRYGAYDATKPFASNSMRMIALDGAEALAWTAAGVVAGWLPSRPLPTPGGARARGRGGPRGPAAGPPPPGATAEEAMRPADSTETRRAPGSLENRGLWWRGRDLNPRPPGYEPGELPNCSTPRRPVQSTQAPRSGQGERACGHSHAHSARRSRIAGPNPGRTPRRSGESAISPRMREPPRCVPARPRTRRAASTDPTRDSPPVERGRRPRPHSPCRPPPRGREAESCGLIPPC